MQALFCLGILSHSIQRRVWKDGPWRMARVWHQVSSSIALCLVALRQGLSLNQKFIFCLGSTCLPSLVLVFDTWSHAWVYEGAGDSNLCLQSKWSYALSHLPSSRNEISEDSSLAVAHSLTIGCHVRCTEGDSIQRAQGTVMIQVHFGREYFENLERTTYCLVNDCEFCRRIENVNRIVKSVSWLIMMVGG